MQSLQSYDYSYLSGSFHPTRYLYCATPLHTSYREIIAIIGGVRGYIENMDFKQNFQFNALPAFFSNPDLKIFLRNIIKTTFEIFLLLFIFPFYWR